MSSTEFLINLTRSIALALSLTFAYSLFAPYIARYPFRVRAVMQGVLFGLFAVLDMATAERLAGGFVFDSRTILIAISGVFGGPIPAVITSLIVALYRAVLGGGGAIPGVVGIIITCILSVLFYLRFRQHPPLSGLIILGITITISAVIGIALLGGETAGQLAVAVAPSFLVFNPLGIVLINSLLMREQRELDMAQSLARERQMLRTLIDYLPDYIFVKDADLRFVVSNIAHARAVNIQVDDMIGKTAVELFPADMAANFEADDRRVLESEEALINAERITTDAAGNERRVLTSKVPFRNQDGKIAGLVGISRDITRRKQAEEALTAERNLLRTLIDSTPDFIYIKDTQSRFVMANNAVLTASGLTEDKQIAGKTDFDFFPAEIAQPFYDDDQRIFASGRALVNKEESSIHLKTGQKVWFLTTKVPLKDEHGAITSLLGISRDITEHKRAEGQALELALEKEKVQLLADFIRDASHDLKTPLTVIESSLYLLQRSTEAEKQKRHSDAIEQQVARLSKLIDDLLLTVRLDSGDEFAFERLKLNLIVREVYSVALPLAKKHGLTLTLQSDETISPVRGDEGKLVQAVHSLVENAINYTLEGGSVIIRTAMSDHHAVIEVQDTGIGITADDQAHIFERFYRADKARSTQTGGSGLGLPIAHKIIEAHKGTIKVESAAGQGSTFRVLLPVEDSPQE